MKKNGSLMECAMERTIDIMKATDRYISSCSHIRMPEVYQSVASSPAPRFYTTDTRAAVVVAAMIAGREYRYSGMRPLKREMFEEIRSRVVAIMEEDPEASILECCARVVVQPAPKFYLSPSSVKCIVCRNRKWWNRRKMERIYRYAKRGNGNIGNIGNNQGK